MDRFLFMLPWQLMPRSSILRATRDAKAMRSGYRSKNEEEPRMEEPLLAIPLTVRMVSLSGD